MINFDDLFDRPEQTPPLELLSGGYRNWNYRLLPTEQLEQPDLDRVLRLSAEPEHLAVESALLNYLAQAQPELHVPRVLHQLPGLLITRFCPGELASCLDKRLPDVELNQLGQMIGLTLAQVHALRFTHNGFFNQQLEITEPLEPFAEAWRGYIYSVMTTEPARNRAGETICHQVLELIKDHGQLLDGILSRRLVHSDFNLKNLLVQQNPDWCVSGLLDWEFAHVGAPLQDLGNFFRFEEQLPFALLEGFLSAYQAEMGPLEANWRAQAHLLDLAALSGFLAGATDRPKSQATAINRMQRCLDYFDDSEKL